MLILKFDSSSWSCWTVVILYCSWIKPCKAHSIKELAEKWNILELGLFFKPFDKIHKAIFAMLIFDEESLNNDTLCD